MDSKSLPVGFDGQVPRESTFDFPNHALGGDWGSRKDLYAMVVLPGGVDMFQGVGDHTAKECNVSYDRVFCFSNSDRRSQLGRKVGPS